MSARLPTSDQRARARANHLRVQGTDTAGKDGWIGNIAIDPTKGKKAMQPPPDPKGRKGLAEVLSSTSKGEAALDGETAAARASAPRNCVCWQSRVRSQRCGPRTLPVDVVARWLCSESQR